MFIEGLGRTLEEVERDSSKDGEGSVVTLLEDGEKHVPRQSTSLGAKDLPEREEKASKVSVDDYYGSCGLESSLWAWWKDGFGSGKGSRGEGGELDLFLRCFPCDERAPWVSTLTKRRKSEYSNTLFFLLSSTALTLKYVH